MNAAITHLRTVGYGEYKSTQRHPGGLAALEPVSENPDFTHAAVFTCITCGIEYRVGIPSRRRMIRLRLGALVWVVIGLSLLLGGVCFAAASDVTWLAHLWLVFTLFLACVGAKTVDAAGKSLILSMDGTRSIGHEVKIIP